MWYRPMVGNDHRAACCFYFFLPNPHALALVLRHYVQSSPHLFDRSSIAKQNLSHRANVICDWSPSRILMTRRISFGMTTRPKSSIRLTMPVAFIYIIPPTVVFWKQNIVWTGKRRLCVDHSQGPIPSCPLFLYAFVRHTKTKSLTNR